MAGVVRIAVSAGYGYQVVPSLLTPLLHKHREFEIELGSNSSDNLPVGAFMACFDRLPMPIAHYVHGRCRARAPRFR